MVCHCLAEPPAEQYVSTALSSRKKAAPSQKPVFLQPLTSCSVPHGEVARFHALVSGTPTPVISWFHNRQPVLPTKNVVFHYDELTSTATLIVVDAFPEHAGQYTCRATNLAGEAVCSATLDITEARREEEGMAEEETS
uniref:Ig-like domain-containing protein n=1 Tax=Hippocampus comes TaxID=109280 RepID=A0A3Q3E3P7_HIPCM